MVVFGDFVKFKNQKSGWVLIVPHENNFTLGAPEYHYQNNIDNAGVFQLLDQNGSVTGKSIKSNDNVTIRAWVNGMKYYLQSPGNSCGQVFLVSEPSVLTNTFYWKLDGPETIVINKKNIKIRSTASEEIAFTPNAPKCNGYDSVDFTTKKNSIDQSHYFVIEKVTPSPIYPKPTPIYPAPLPLYPRPQPLYPQPIPLQTNALPLYPQPQPFNPKPQPLNPQPVPFNPQPQPLNPQPIPLQTPLIPLDDMTPVPLQPQVACKWYQKNDDGVCEVNKYLVGIPIALVVLIILLALS